MIKHLSFLAILFPAIFTLVAMERPEYYEPYIELAINDKVNLPLKNVLAHIFTFRVVTTDDDAERISGLHHYGAYKFIAMKHMNGTLVKINKNIWLFTEGDVNEFHIGYVIYNGKVFLEPKTFFPSNWNQVQVTKYIQSCKSYKSQKVQENDVQINHVILAKPAVENAIPIKIILREQKLDNSLLIYTLYPFINLNKKIGISEQLRQNLETLALQQATESQNSKQRGKLKEPKIFDIIAKQDLSTLQNILQIGADANIANGNNKTPIMAAAALGNLEMCSLLLEFGAEKYDEDQKGNIPLHYAVNSGSYFTSLGLINRIYVNKQNNEGNTPLIQTIVSLCDALKDTKTSSSKEYLDIISLLFHFHADPNIKNRYGRTPLISVICALDNKAIAGAVAELLISNGADVDLADANATTPLMYAIEYDRPNIVQILLKHHADLELTNNDKMTAIKISEKRKTLEIIKLIGQWIANKNAWISENGANEFLHSAFSNNMKSCKKLANPISINTQDVNGQTALYYAVINNNAKMVEFLISNGADPRIKTAYNLSIVDIAQNEKVNQNIIERLDQEAEKLDAPNKSKEEQEKLQLKNQRMLFVQEIKNGGKLSLETLGNLTTFLNKKLNTAGYTPLLFAIKEQNIEAVKQIVQMPGVDLRIEDANRENVLDYSKNNRAIFETILSTNLITISMLQNFVKKLILEKNLPLLSSIAKLSKSYLFQIILNFLANSDLEYIEFLITNKIIMIEPKEINALFFESINRNNESALCLLLKYYCSFINNRDTEGKTALMHATILGRNKCVELLCNQGADIEIKDNSKRSVWDFAKGSIFKMLQQHQEKLKKEQSLRYEAEKRKSEEKELQIKYGWTSPLMIAAYLNDTNTIRNDSTSNINEVDDNGQSSLIIASKQGNLLAVEELCKKQNINLDHQDINGCTALMHAIKSKNRSIMSLLMRNGANVLLVNNEGCAAQSLIMAEFPEFKKLIDECKKRDCAKFVKELIKTPTADIKKLLSKFLANEPDALFIIECVNDLKQSGNTILSGTFMQKAQEIISEKDISLEFAVESSEDVLEMLLALGCKITPACFVKVLNSEIKYDIRRAKLLWLIPRTDADILKMPLPGLRNAGNVSLNLMDLICGLNDVGVVSSIIERINEPNYINMPNNGITALSIAVHYGNAKTVAELIRRGANVNYQCPKAYDDETPLIMACKFTNDQIFHNLMDAKADLAPQDSKGYTALMHAIESYHPEKNSKKVRAILKRVMSLPYDQALKIINTQSKNGDTALTLAFSKKILKIAKTLIYCGADPKALKKYITDKANHKDTKADDFQYTDFLSWISESKNHQKYNIFESQKNSQEIILKFVENLDWRGLRIACDFKDGGNKPINESGMTNLMAEVKSGNTQTINYLINQADLNINQTDKFGNTALFYAVNEEHQQQDIYDFIAEQLIKAGAKINVTNNMDETPLICAANNNNTKLFKRLVEEGAEYNPLTLGRICINKGNAEAFKYILSQIPLETLNTKTALGVTLLGHACATGMYKIIELLLDKGVDVNISDTAGNTPLISFCKRDSEKNFESLLGLANESSECFNYITLDKNEIFKMHQDQSEKIVNRLLKAGANLKAKNNLSETAFTCAFKAKNNRLLKFLLTEDAPNIKDEYSNTILHLMVALPCSSEEFKIFLNHPVFKNCINCVNKAGDTPLMLAAHMGRFYHVNQLIMAGADLHVQTDEGDTAYTLAEENKYQDVVDLLSTHIKPISYDKSLSNEEHYVLETDVAKMVLTKHPSVVKMLEKTNVNFNKLCISLKCENSFFYDRQFESEKALCIPLSFIAAANGYTKLLNILKANKVDLNLKKYGRTPLSIACRANDLSMVKFLLDSGVKIDEYALVTACSAHSLEIVKLLIKYGANVNIVCPPSSDYCLFGNECITFESGCTPLERVISCCQNIRNDDCENRDEDMKIADLLVKNGASIPYEDLLGHAVRQYSIKKLSWLFKNGLKTSKKTENILADIIDNCIQDNYSRYTGKEPDEEFMAFTLDMIKLCIEQGADKNELLGVLQEAAKTTPELNDSILMKYAQELKK